MHTMIVVETYDNPGKPADLEVQLTQSFSGLKWLSPLPGVFIVQVASSDEYTTMYSAIRDVAKEHTKYVSLIVSPPMASGRYKGWLPSPIWPKLRELTDVSGD